jgi:hypothetical protein
MGSVQYGVFKLGQIWTVADQGGARLGFKDRETAIAALQAMIAVHRACGKQVAVTVQDNAGRLRTLSNPTGDLTFDLGAHETAWGALMNLGQPTGPGHGASGDG